MQLVERWTAIEQGLDPRWSDACLGLAIEDETQRSRALALLAPAGPGGMAATIRFYVTRSGAGVGPEAVRRMLRKLEEEGIRGTLELVSSEEAVLAPTPARASLAADWDAAIAVLPADWSDLLCELELTSSDHVERAALLIAPVNPVQADTGRLGFRFRSAHTFGYGASSGMVRRCLARLDEDGIPGEVRIVRALSDTHPVATQGPVWYVGGKAV
jgi:DNA-binding Lrp family transcriptional regulator